MCVNVSRRALVAEILLRRGFPRLSIEYEDVFLRSDADFRTPLYGRRYDSANAAWSTRNNIGFSRELYYREKYYEIHTYMQKTVFVDKTQKLFVLKFGKKVFLCIKSKS